MRCNPKAADQLGSALNRNHQTMIQIQAVMEYIVYTTSDVEANTRYEALINLLLNLKCKKIYLV